MLVVGDVRVGGHPRGEGEGVGGVEPLTGGTELFTALCQLAGGVVVGALDAEGLVDEGGVDVVGGPVVLGGAAVQA